MKNHFITVFFCMVEIFMTFVSFLPVGLDNIKMYLYLVKNDDGLCGVCSFKFLITQDLVFVI